MSDLQPSFMLRLDDFEMTATVDPLRLTESVEVKLFHQMLEMETFETILTGKRNPKRFNDNH